LSTPWVFKHRPKSLAEVAGNKDSIQTLLNWVKSWWRKTPSKRGILIHGPPGVGKTVTVEALAGDLKLDLVEVNASDKRTGDALRKVAGAAATQAGLFGDRRIILLDEVDGINLSEDVGAVDGIVDVLKAAQCPVVLTANNPWDPKLRSIRDHCTMLGYKRLGVRDSMPYLKNLCVKEGLEVDEDALRFIFDRNKGDMRSIINDLESLAAGWKKIGLSDVGWLSQRDRKDQIFEVLGRIFRAKSCISARRAMDSADVDYNMLFEWIYENLPQQLSHPEDLANAMENLAKADLYLSWVKRKQRWDLLPYALDLMTAGVAMSREKTKPSFVLFKFPQRILALSKTKKVRALRQSLGRSIGAKCHTSSATAIKEIVPHLRFISQNNPDRAAQLSKWLNLDEETASLLAGSKVEAEKKPKTRKRLK